MMVKKRSGFTLVEAAVTASLAAVVGLAVFSSLSSGLKMWSAGQRTTPVADMVLFFEKVAMDTENSPVYPGLMGQGNATRFSFPSRVKDAPGVVVYTYDQDSQTVFRAGMTLGESMSGPSVPPTPVFDKAVSCAFAYYFFDDEVKEYAWSGTWPPEEGMAKELRWPLAVCVVLSLNIDEKTVEFKRTFPFPLARP